MILKDQKKTHAKNLYSLGLCGPDADVNVADRHSVTPLIQASATGHFFVVKRLLAMGANVHAEDKWGFDALIEASDAGHAKIVRLLIAHGAKVNPKKAIDYTSLMAAAEWGHSRVMEILLKKGAKVNAIDPRGRTALNTAAIDRWHTIPLLLSYGADVHAVNDSALLTASQCGTYHAVNLLLAHGANVNACDGDGCMALMWSARLGWPDVVKALLEKGADRAATDEHGKTAKDYADQVAEYNSEDINQAIRQLLS